MWRVCCHQLKTRQGNFTKEHTAEEIKNKGVDLPGVYAQSADATGVQLIGADDLIGGAVHSQHQSFVGGKVCRWATGVTRCRT